VKFEEGKMRRKRKRKEKVTELEGKAKETGK
jgi:hypothetical protein